VRIIGLVILCLFSSWAAADSACNLPSQIFSPSIQAVDCVNKVTPDSYALALSWSPQFCSSVNPNSGKYAHQCRKNNFKFVVHGLWPQIKTAKNKCEHPRNCETSAVDQSIIKQMMCMMPSESLIQGEWQKHGTCSGMSTQAYFDQTAQLWNRLNKPDVEALLDAQGMTSGYDIVSAFVAANPKSGLTRSAVSVSVTEGALEEVLICYDLQFRYAACKPGQKSSKVKIRVARAH